MNVQIVATLIAEGSRFISELIKMRPIHSTTVTPMETLESISSRLESSEDRQPMVSSRLESSEDIQSPMSGMSEQATKIATGCIPCAIGHLGTCSGLLNESIRFAYKDGLASEDTIRKVNQCLDELNAMERDDLRPEMIHALPVWEKELAKQALTISRDTRHRLEGLTSVEDLEGIAANTQKVRNDVGHQYFQQKLQNLTPAEKQRIKERVIQNLERGAITESETDGAEGTAEELTVIE